MIKIDSPITILEFGSTGARLVIFNKLKLHQFLKFIHDLNIYQAIPR